ncbi:hypothetical protein ACCAA_1790007 [Candidatus Accumulibacter aalborgensis]|uniref:Uncharacterized protein n=1 Tax=Candidatus Accumulibacter aalborgensis TaxID=1860102 RepID=A0A1A8XL65_9PROT|nr:hypothetical protein ACCAA_1790007 [Candidatus Accumulibacter aalborgensis]
MDRFQEFRIAVVGEEGTRGAAGGPGLKPAEAVCRPTTWRLRARIALARVNRSLHTQGLSFRPPDLAQRRQNSQHPSVGQRTVACPHSSSRSFKKKERPDPAHLVDPAHSVIRLAGLSSSLFFQYPENADGRDLCGVDQSSAQALPVLEC